MTEHLCSGCGANPPAEPPALPGGPDGLCDWCRRIEKMLSDRRAGRPNPDLDIHLQGD